MKWELYWEALEAKKGGKITGTVTLTAEQFKKMQRQAFDQGLAEGGGQVKSKDTLDTMFGDMFKGRRS